MKGLTPEPFAIIIANGQPHKTGVREMYNYDDEFDDVCPRCRVGRMQLSTRPYLELYRGHLFTVPDAVCYECDVCGLVEFDESTIKMIGDMVTGASFSQNGDDERFFQQPPPPDDDAPRKPQQPPA